MRFDHKVCLVTGAGSGICMAVALQLAREGGTVVFAKCNVGDPAEASEAVQVAVHQWKKIDVLVNDAAMMTFKPILDLSAAEWHSVQTLAITCQ